MIYLVSLFVFIADYLTKLWAVSALTFGESRAIMPYFNLFLVSNRGISFSLFSADNTSGVILLILITLAICGYIIYLIKTETDTFSRVALAMVLGGALGNIIDRIQYGFVVDFLDFYWGKYHFPAFNVADSFITIGVGLYLFRMITKKENTNA